MDVGVLSFVFNVRFCYYHLNTLTEFFGETGKKNKWDQDLGLLLYTYAFQSVNFFKYIQDIGNFIKVLLGTLRFL